MKTDWNALQEKIGAWSDEKGTELKGLLVHLIEETEDLAKEPFNSLAYADVLILLLSAARKAKYSMDELYAAVEAKHSINLGREWMEADENGITRRKS